MHIEHVFLQMIQGHPIGRSCCTKNQEGKGLCTLKKLMLNLFCLTWETMQIMQI
jgi:hypothetical protein